VQAAVAHSTIRGWPPARYRELGAGWVVRSHWIEYLRPVFAGERVLVRTWVANFHKITSLRKYRIERPADGVLLAVAETKWAFIDFQDRSPRRVPAELSGAFELVSEAAEP
jgi:acyl-CoA thioester hydrolase